MEPARSSEMLVTYCNTTCCHNPENLDLYQILLCSLDWMIRTMLINVMW